MRYFALHICSNTQILWNCTSSQWKQIECSMPYELSFCVTAGSLNGLWLGTKKCEMWECGVFMSVLKEGLEKYFGGAMKSSKSWGLVFIGWLCLGFLFTLGIKLVYISQSLIYRHIEKYSYIAE